MNNIAHNASNCAQLIPTIKYGPKKLLKGKTSRIIITANTPKWHDSLFMKSPAINQFKKGTLEFCGISPVKVTYISPIKGSNAFYKENWLRKIALLGEKLK